jgi:hypothetical protein
MADIQSLLKQGVSVLSSALQASIKLEKTKTSTLFGVAGGLFGLIVILISNAWLGISLFPSLPITFALGVTLGHVTVRSLRGFKAEAEAEAERLKFDEMIRRYKTLRALSPDVAPHALEGLMQTFLPLPASSAIGNQLPAPSLSSSSTASSSSFPSSADIPQGDETL